MLLEELADPEVAMDALRQLDQLDRNVVWFEDHLDEIVRRHRGKYVCISMGDLFVADDVHTVTALAQAAHPDDDGRFVYRVPDEKAARVYAH